jgi:hypothetical protein
VPSKRGVIAILILAFNGSGCANGPRSLPRPPSVRPDVPFVFVWEASGYVLPEDNHTGVLIAVWSDGRIIRATNRDQCGRSYVRAMLSPTQLHDVCRAIEQSGVLRSRPNLPILVDFSTEQLSVRRGRRFYEWTHCPGLSGTNNADSTNPRLAAIVDALMALPLIDPRPEPAKPWRGRFLAQWEH